MSQRVKMKYSLSIILLTFFGLLNSDFLSAKESGQRLLLSIGIGNFSSDHWQDLKYSEKDATDIAEFFREQASPSFDRIELLNSKESLVSSNDVLSAIDRLDVQNQSETDIVMLYISTHGSVDVNRKGQIVRYLITSESDENNLLETAIPYTELIQKFRQLKSRKKVLILDFCYSGIGKSKITPQILDRLAKLKSDYFANIDDEEVTGEYILTASGPNQAAQESAKLENGVYTHFLLKGFRQDLNEDGVVTLTEAHNYSRARTYSYTKGEQSPTFQITLEGSDPIYIMGEKPKELTASIFSFWRGHEKYQLYIDGIYKGLLSKGAKVPAGRSHVRIVDIETGEVAVNKYIYFDSEKEYPAIMLFQKYYNFQTIFGTNAQKLNSYSSAAYGMNRGQFIKVRFFHIFGSWDGSFKLSYSKADDQFSKSYSDVAATLNYSQSREHLSLYSLIGSHRRFSIADFPQSKISGTWHSEAGLLVEHAKRTIATLEINDSLIHAGLSAGTQVEMLLPIYGLNIGLGLSMDALPSYWDDNEKISYLVGGELYFGLNF